jgi:hypothetical protein
MPESSGIRPLCSEPARKEKEMSLHTSIVRDSVPLPLRWGGWHIAVMIYVASLESGFGPFRPCTPEGILGDAPARAHAADPSVRLVLGEENWLPLYMCGYAALAATPLNNGPWKVRQSWTFTDPDDGEVLILQPGDELHAFRG